MKKMIRITAAIFILVLGIAVALPENDVIKFRILGRLYWSNLCLFRLKRFNYGRILRAR